VRIRPQQHEGEAIASLIEDPWRVFDCEPDSGGCAVTFSDPDYASAGRDHLYYVRAIEEPTQVINAQNLRCQASGDDTCAAVDPCSGQDDLCLGTAEPKAWSSPIFIDWGVREQQAAR
jgi:hypothetical protein